MGPFRLLLGEQIFIYSFRASLHNVLFFNNILVVTIQSSSTPWHLFSAPTKKHDGVVFLFHEIKFTSQRCFKFKGTMYHRTMHISRGPILLSIGPVSELILMLRIMLLKTRERERKTHMSWLFKKVSYNGYKSHATLLYITSNGLFFFQWILRDCGMCVPKTLAPSQLFLTHGNSKPCAKMCFQST